MEFRASDLIQLIRKPSKLWPSLNSHKTEKSKTKEKGRRRRDKEGKDFNDGLSLDGFLDHELQLDTENPEQVTYVYMVKSCCVISAPHTVSKIQFNCIVLFQH